MTHPSKVAPLATSDAGHCAGLGLTAAVGLAHRVSRRVPDGRLRRRVRWTCAFLSPVVFVTLMPVVLEAGELVSYSLTQVSTSPGDGQTAVTRWFITPMKSRTELSPDASNPDEGLVVITRRDKGLAWTLFPAREAYMERSLDEEELRELGNRFKGGLDVEELGREKILGYDCDKQRVRSEVDLGSRTVKGARIVWRCDGFAVPLRIDGEGGSQTKTTQLMVGPQPDHLFEVPSGYRQRGSVRDIMRLRRIP